MKKLIWIIIITLLIGLFPRQRASQLDAATTRKFTRTGKASWYSRRSPGIKRHTANNEVFNENALTCAMWGVEFGRKIKVTNLENGKKIIVRVNDRGPSEHYVRKGRIIDLTKAAFRKLSPTHKGLITVEIEFL